MVRPNKRKDLVDAYAAIDWAVSQLPMLEESIEAFLADKPYRIVKENNPDMEGVRFVLKEVKAPAPSLNAQVGAILNSTRSSLDLLSASLARRNGKTPTRYMHFPIWDNPNDFYDPRRGVHGSERKQWLAEGERRIVEALKPYPGGNDDIWSLHQLDIIRKHERLVGVSILAQSMRIQGDAAAAGLRRTPNWTHFQNDTVIAVSPVDASEGDIDLTLHVTLNEGALSHSPIIRGQALLFPKMFHFARLADNIIQRFDYP